MDFCYGQNQEHKLTVLQTADPGNVGFLVGPPFFDAILAQTSSASFQGVPYSASVTGFLEGGDPAGAPMMAAQVRQAISQCPGSKIIMGGYSQGGQIVHQAATALGSTMGSVTAVVIFGDPGIFMKCFAFVYRKLILFRQRNCC
jgi:cutinase